MTGRLGAVVLGLAVAMTATGTAPLKALRFGQVWDGTRMIPRGVIFVEGNRIVSVGTPDRAALSGADVIDLSSFTAIPGLIDLHTHMTYYWDRAPGTRPRGQSSRTAEETVKLAAADNGRRTLETGVTTVRDLGASRGTDISMRDQINAGTMIGPRMFVAGQGISAGGGASTDTDAMRQATETRLGTTADWVKVYASRGSFQSVDTTQTIGFDALKVIVDTAHAKGRKVAIHSYGASGVKDAVRAGADSVEHGIELDDETLAEMVKRGTVWVPTIDHNRYYVDAKDDFGFAPETIPPLRGYIEKNLESTRRAFKAGVRLGMGSDAVYSMFGENTRELGWFVKAGMTPAQALGSATTVAAELLAMQDKLGRIAPGYLADIVAVAGNPLDQIEVLFTGVRWVMKDGAVVVDKIRPQAAGPRPKAK